MDRNWLRSAAKRYDESNRATLEFILSRKPLMGAFVDTKVHSISGENYDDTSGIRGPKFTFGWIQARALEALITFTHFYSDRDLSLSRRLTDRAKLLFEGLDALFKRDGHVYFLYDSDLNPVFETAGSTIRQQIEPSIFTYSDAFAAKGLFAASRVFAPEQSSAYLNYLLSVIESVEDGRFQMNETIPISRQSLSDQADDFGPRMILLGAAGLLHRHGETTNTNFANRFIDYVFDRHYHAQTGLLLNVPKDDTCNVGHAIELCGFGFEHLQAIPDDTRLHKLVSVLVQSLQVGLQGPGIALYLSAKTGRATSKYYPWWPMPEAIRACALGMHLDPSLDLFNLWKKCDHTFFNNYWQKEKGFAVQTRDLLGPVDFVPATPDLDPGYHTGLSLLGAAKKIDGLLKE